MSQIDIVREHTLSMAKGRSLMRSLAEELAAQYAATYTIDDDVVSFKAPGITGTVALLPKSVDIKATLGFLMRPLKGVIEKQIHDGLDRILKEGASDAPSAKSTKRTSNG